MKLTPLHGLAFNRNPVVMLRSQQHHDALAKQGVAYVPFFPLGGFTQLQSSGLYRMAAFLQTTPAQVALAWLLHVQPNILLIPGSSSTSHLREGVTRNFWKGESNPSLSILGNLPRTRSRGS